MPDIRDTVLEALDDEDFHAAERHLRARLAGGPASGSAAESLEDDEEVDRGVMLALLALVVLAQDRADEATAAAELAVEASPELAYTHWALGNVLAARNRFAEALRAVDSALRLDPDDSDAHALAARALAGQGRWQDALGAASRGLAIDPEHVPSAKVRALALRQLGRTAEADAAFAEVAAAAPLDPFANAGRAWTLLREGRRDDAIEQFREALRLDPSAEWARDGLVAAFKARNPFYRAFLRYFIWIGTRTRGQQLLFVVGGMVLFRTLRRLARAQPELAPVLWPLIGAYVVFLLGSWLADPLFDLLLRLDPVGRRALSAERRRASEAVGVCLLVALVAGLAAWATGSAAALTLAASAALLLIPLAGTFQCDAGWPRTAMGGYTAVLAAAAATAVLSPAELRTPLMAIVVVGSVAGSWLVRWLATVTPSR
jgi:tetratricopeptide (TPR) repeat protein